MSGDIDLPFEPQDPTPMHDAAEAFIAGGVVVMSAVIDSDDGLLPAVVFRFAAADGSGFHRPILLAGTDEDIAKLRSLVIEAVQQARRNAKGLSS